MVTGVLTLLQVGVAVLLRTSAESVSVSLTLPGAPFPHYWERCIGSGHGALTLREDWRLQLRKLLPELRLLAQAQMRHERN